MKKQTRIVINRFKAMKNHTPFIAVEIFADRYDNRIYDFKTDEEMNAVTDEDIKSKILLELAK